ncbi:hypothetical protein EJB05_27123 [Eragrostis curvula]|uniref:NB-ARC domain-containing protein n=1 Tax=Eragrostis curvula TaxID=38414 RepID=A0A5J9ULP7_9POAL|nr:hypothetical protein EJB05_27123 [Eragrostis curvula]
MSGVFASRSVGTAWEKVFVFLRAFTASSISPSSSPLVPMDLEELTKLERTMRRILATLHDAEEHWNIQEESTKLRLRELKELAYDIEDVINEFKADRRKAGVLERSISVHYNGKRKRQEENETADTGVAQVPYNLVYRTKKLTERFNEIMQFSNHFALSENDGEKLFAPNINSSQHTSSFIFEKRILGLDDDKDILIEKLLSGEGENGGSHVSVMAIVGIGGLGKTTLAQLVYNDQRLRQSFDKHAWVYVSEHFDIPTMTKNIICSLTKGACEYTELADLQEVLADELRDKRVLLVLDDICNERGDCWELLCMPMSTARICQIILTTRSEAVARLVQTTPFYCPRCLTFDESWSLFRQIVFPADEVFDTPDETLIEIGKNIIRKCKGLPLAVKTLGIKLRYETDKQIWEDALENELWDLEPISFEVLQAFG